MDYGSSKDHLKRDPSLLPKLPVAISPKKIVNTVSLQSSEITSLFDELEACGNYTTQNELEYAAIKESCVKQIEESTWIVKETDGLTP